jgi:hypothetical protein
LPAPIDIWAWKRRESISGREHESIVHGFCFDSGLARRGCNRGVGVVSVHVHGVRRVGMMLLLGSGGGDNSWMSCRRGCEGLRRGLKFCDVGRDDLAFPFLGTVERPIRERFRTRKKTWFEVVLTLCNSARTSSATPYSSNSDLMDEMTSSITAR